MINVIPIERELHRVQKQISDAEWDNRSCNHLKSLLAILKEQIEEGEKYYIKF